MYPIVVSLPKKVTNIDTTQNWMLADSTFSLNRFDSIEPVWLIVKGLSSRSLFGKTLEEPIETTTFFSSDGKILALETSYEDGKHRNTIELVPCDNQQIYLSKF